VLFALGVGCGQAARHGNADGAHGNVDSVGRKRHPLTKDNGFQGVIVGEHNDGDFSASSGLAGSGGDASAQRLQLFRAIFGAVIDGERVSSLDQIACHGGTHIA
jgi:hypothetical protein